ncbi:hypothetical protein HRI_000753500 [Hibiscus trionum]|uniref:FtsH ternary system domain-containing protein n=1 Tax=Hibiscus trionum TaxID=183268 RepID=A0A9W7H559_HIBTR|nr:hypothetical protein HRI_000753500 [Hibiscus trionum]
MHSPPGCSLGVILGKEKGQSIQHPYGTRRRTKMVNEDRLDQIEQTQRDMQADLTKTLEDQLAKAQEEMREQLRKSQEDILAQISQMLGTRPSVHWEASNGNPVTRPTVENEDLTYPLGFTPTHVRVQATPQVILDQGKMPLHQTDIPFPANVPSAPEERPGGNQTDNFVSNIDQLMEIEKPMFEASKEIADHCKRLEEMLEAMEMVNAFIGFDAVELSLVPDLMLPLKFKVPEFEKYDGTSCPRAHLTMFCRRMTGYGGDDKLLIHCF